MTPRNLIFIVIAAASLLLASCGDDGDTDTTAGGDTSNVAGDAGDGGETGGDDNSVIDDAEDLGGGMADSLEDLQDAEGGGSATFTVGDQTWTFDSVLCAIGEEETGQAGAEFVLSSIQEGLQMYVSIDSFGHTITLNDIENFDDPSVNLSTFADDNFIVLDGKNVTAEAGFLDGGGTDLTETPGTFSGTCP